MTPTNMTIHYDNTDDFYYGIKELVIKGLTFRACYDTLIIYVTGY